MYSTGAASSRRGATSSSVLALEDGGSRTAGVNRSLATDVLEPAAGTGSSSFSAPAPPAVGSSTTAYDDHELESANFSYPEILNNGAKIMKQDGASGDGLCPHLSGTTTRPDEPTSADKEGMLREADEMLISAVLTHLSCKTLDRNWTVDEEIVGFQERLKNRRELKLPKDEDHAGLFSQQHAAEPEEQRNLYTKPHTGFFGCSDEEAMKKGKSYLPRNKVTCLSSAKPLDFGQWQKTYQRFCRTPWQYDNLISDVDNFHQFLEELQVNSKSCFTPKTAADMEKLLRSCYVGCQQNLDHVIARNFLNQAEKNNICRSSAALGGQTSKICRTESEEMLIKNSGGTAGGTSSFSSSSTSSAGVTKTPRIPPLLPDYDRKENVFGPSAIDWQHVADMVNHMSGAEGEHPSSGAVVDEEMRSRSTFECEDKHSAVDIIEGNTISFTNTTTPRHQAPEGSCGSASSSTWITIFTKRRRRIPLHSSGRTAADENEKSQHGNKESRKAKGQSKNQQASSCYDSWSSEEFDFEDLLEQPTAAAHSNKEGLDYNFMQESTAEDEDQEECADVDFFPPRMVTPQECRARWDTVLEFSLAGSVERSREVEHADELGGASRASSRKNSYSYLAEVEPGGETTSTFSTRGSWLAFTPKEDALLIKLCLQRADDLLKKELVALDHANAAVAGEQTEVDSLQLPNTFSTRQQLPNNYTSSASSSTRTPPSHPPDRRLTSDHRDEDLLRTLVKTIRAFEPESWIAVMFSFHEKLEQRNRKKHKKLYRDLAKKLKKLKMLNSNGITLGAQSMTVPRKNNKSGPVVGGVKKTTKSCTTKNKKNVKKEVQKQKHRLSTTTTSQEAVRPESRRPPPALLERKVQQLMAEFEEQVTPLLEFRQRPWVVLHDRVAFLLANADRGGHLHFPADAGTAAKLAPARVLLPVESSAGNAINIDGKMNKDSSAKQQASDSPLLKSRFAASSKSSAATDDEVNGILLEPPTGNKQKQHQGKILRPEDDDLWLPSEKNKMDSASRAQQPAFDKGIEVAWQEGGTSSTSVNYAPSSGPHVQLVGRTKNELFLERLYRHAEETVHEVYRSQKACANTERQPSFKQITNMMYKLHEDFFLTSTLLRLNNRILLRDRIRSLLDGTTSTGASPGPAEESCDVVVAQDKSREREEGLEMVLDEEDDLLNEKVLVAGASSLLSSSTSAIQNNVKSTTAGAVELRANTTGAGATLLVPPRSTSRSSLQKKYSSKKKKKAKRPVRWTAAERLQLETLCNTEVYVHKNATKTPMWAEIAREIGNGKTGTNCRDHYRAVTMFAATSGFADGEDNKGKKPWTASEDKKIIEFGSTPALSTATSWEALGRELNRKSALLRYRWKVLAAGKGNKPKKAIKRNSEVKKSKVVVAKSKKKKVQPGDTSEKKTVVQLHKRDVENADKKDEKKLLAPAENESTSHDAASAVHPMKRARGRPMKVVSVIKRTAKGRPPGSKNKKPAVSHLNKGKNPPGRPKGAKDKKARKPRGT
ncbi:unnamed protein product [Amoebophrya sp. A120]|nr:unnamed protein product [Amoebophrya sp. A120]|eukprot:GSA120T00006222001.1